MRWIKRRRGGRGCAGSSEAQGKRRGEEGTRGSEREKRPRLSLFFPKTHTQHTRASTLIRFLTRVIIVRSGCSGPLMSDSTRRLFRRQIDQAEATKRHKDGAFTSSCVASDPRDLDRIAVQETTVRLDSTKARSDSVPSSRPGKIECMSRKWPNMTPLPSPAYIPI